MSGGFQPPPDMSNAPAKGCGGNGCGAVQNTIRTKRTEFATCMVTANLAANAMTTCRNTFKTALTAADGILYPSSTSTMWAPMEYEMAANDAQAKKKRQCNAIPLFRFSSGFLPALFGFLRLFSASVILLSH